MVPTELNLVTRMVTKITHRTVTDTHYAHVVLYYSLLNGPHFAVGTTVSSIQKKETPKGKLAPQVHTARKENPWACLIPVPDRSWESILVITFWVFLKRLVFHL